MSLSSPAAGWGGERQAFYSYVPYSRVGVRFTTTEFCRTVHITVAGGNDSKRISDKNFLPLVWYPMRGGNVGREGRRDICRQGPEVCPTSKLARITLSSNITLTMLHKIWKGAVFSREMFMCEYTCKHTRTVLSIIQHMWRLRLLAQGLLRC